GPLSLASLLAFVAEHSQEPLADKLERLRAEGEQRQRRNVRTVASDEDFGTALAEADKAGKLALVVFSTPARAQEANYLPFLAQLSTMGEQELVVLEVDVAQLKTL